MVIIKLLNNFDKKIIIKYIILIIFTLIIQSISIIHYVNIVPTYITILNILFLFVYLFFIIISFKQNNKLNQITKDLESTKNYNKSLNALYDNVKGFKHDFDNIINTIGGFIKADDMYGLKKYYSDLRKDCINLKNTGLLNPNVINNSGIYNLLVTEYQKANDINVKVNFEFFFDFNNLHMPIYEFSRILGILIDNAIDAAKECDEKEVNLVFRDSPKNNVQIITIENTYNDKKIDLKKIFDKGVSGKLNHSGIGLWEVKQIEKKYNNIVLHTTVNNKYFKQQLEIYY